MKFNRNSPKPLALVIFLFGCALPFLGEGPQTEKNICCCIFTVGSTILFYLPVESEK